MSEVFFYTIGQIDMSTTDIYIYTLCRFHIYINNSSKIPLFSSSGNQLDICRNFYVFSKFFLHHFFGQIMH